MITIYLAHAIVMPILLLGFVRLAKARLQNRQGPPLLQPLHDLLKLLRKSETVSDTTTWVFRAAPLVQLAAVLCAALMAPWLGLPSAMRGDLFLFIYLLALGRFAMGLAALDAGSAFGALGASREATVSVQVEPAMVLALGSVAAAARSSSFEAMFAPHSYPVVLVPLLMVALALAILAEMARMPFDDPTTHLELTMIHEALILENSGRNLAVVEFASALKMTVLLGLFAQVTRLALPPVQGVAAWALTLSLMAASCGALVVAESTLVKLRWRRIPNLLSFAVAAAALACLVLAL